MSDLLRLLSWGPEGWGDEIVEGALLNIGLALATLPIGLAIGLLVALAKNSRRPVLVMLGNLYTTVFRGLPELLTLLLVYYGGQTLLQWLIEHLVEDPEPVEVSAFVAGMIALGAVFSSYASEVFLSAFKGITRGQIEAARAMGMGRGLTFRLIILPQLWRYALPGIANLWLVLLKDTSLVSIIGLGDVLRNTSVAIGVTKEPLFFWSVVCLIFLVLAIVSSIGTTRIETWAGRGFSGRSK